MGRLLAISLTIMILFFSACTGQSSSDAVLSENAADVLLASNSVSQPVES